MHFFLTGRGFSGLESFFEGRKLAFRIGDKKFSVFDFFFFVFNEIVKFLQFRLSILHILFLVKEFFFLLL